MMKPLLVTTLLINLSILPITTDNPDFLVSDIVVRPNKFIYIKLENRSLFETQIEPEKLDKIFLVIFINQIKRAEYKLKYINKKLFQKHSTVLLRTNFQFTTPIEVRIEMNQDKIISESNYANNTLSKSLK